MEITICNAAKLAVCELWNICSIEKKKKSYIKCIHFQFVYFCVTLPYVLIFLIAVLYISNNEKTNLFYWYIGWFSSSYKHSFCKGYWNFKNILTYGLANLITQRSIESKTNFNKSFCREKFFQDVDSITDLLFLVEIFFFPTKFRNYSAPSDYH